MIPDDAVLAHRDRVMAQQVDGDAVLLDIDSGEYFALNEVGGRVWELCDGRRPVIDIVRAVCDEYDAPPDEVDGDVRALLESLRGAGLVVAG